MLRPFDPGELGSIDMWLGPTWRPTTQRQLPQRLPTRTSWPVVANRVDLQAWQLHLKANGVVRAEVADKPLTHCKETG